MKIKGKNFIFPIKTLTSINPLSSLMLDDVKFSLLIGVKNINFVFNSFRESLFALSQSVRNAEWQKAVPF